MREHDVPQFTVDAHRPVGAFDVLGVCFATELGYTNLLHRARPRRHPAARRRPRRRPPDRHRRRARRVQPRADRRLHRRRGARRRRAGRARDLRRRPRLEGRGPPGRPRRAAAAAGAHRRRLRARVLRRRLPARRPDPAGRAQPRRRAVAGRKHTVMDLDEWPYPKQPLVPLAETVHERMSRRDLPRLHPRLPVLPGRHDHPPGARALDHRHRRDGRARRWQATGFEEVGLLCLSSADHSEIADDHQGSGRPLRGHATPRCRCRAPGSTRSTSTWPTSSPATVAAPA